MGAAILVAGFDRNNALKVATAGTSKVRHDVTRTCVNKAADVAHDGVHTAGKTLSIFVILFHIFHVCSFYT